MNQKQAGSLGGKARAKNLSKKRRREIAALGGIAKGKNAKLRAQKKGGGK